MARRRKQLDIGVDPPDAVEAGAIDLEPTDGSQWTAPSPRSRRRRPFIRVPLDDSGRPDLSGIRPEHREALAEAVGTLPERASVDPALAGMLIQAVARIEGALLGPRFGLDRETAMSIAEPKPPLDELLARQTAVVLSKHNVMGRFGDEVALAALVASWQAGVIQGWKAAAEAAKTKEKQNVAGA
jgi:hypothetical protein